jgi:hypothetical protein
MPKVSKMSTDKVTDYGPAVDRSTDVDGFTVEFVTIKETHDLAPLLESLPGGNCSCPHWGYVLNGRLTVRYPDHEEVIETGDAFYMTPGHAPAAEAGTEFVLFSPTDELAAVEAAIAASMQAAQRA